MIMIGHRLRASLVVIAALAVPASAQAPTPAETRTRVETLASDAFDGRLAGSPGEIKAAEYLSKELTRIGAKPLPGLTSLLVPFTFTAGSKDGGSRVVVTPAGGAPQTFSAPDDVLALAFSDGAEATAEAVFAGYGLVVPSSQRVEYDSYQGLDVKDKVVVVLRYFPEDADADARGVLARYADLRYKAQAARQRGAKAMLVITGPRSPNAGRTAPMTFDTAIAGSGIVAVSVTGAVADRLFAAAGKSLEAVQRDLDIGNPHVAGFPIPGVTVSIGAKVVREPRTGHNVLAYLPATSPVASVARPWVAVGAHYDHLGHGTSGGSLASGDEAGKIHHGADDNASGSAAVLAIAGSLSRQPRKRHVLIALWSGEELGLLGSSAFVTHPAVPIDQLVAYLNFDMVGRMQDNKLIVQGTGTSPVWPPLLERTNVLAGFDLQVESDPYQPTDESSFNEAGVPCLTFFTGAHADYHKPTDTADKIDYADLDRVAKFGAAIVARLMDTDEPPAFTKVEPTLQGGRAELRVFTGTIPDYATDTKGLLLSGVIPGGPAEQAGLQKGDVIVEIGGQSITNIYDYTYALDTLKIGTPVQVVYLRNGDRKETMLTPAARR
jgi:Peptidase family M28/PDZ domain/PA domain